MQKHLLLTILIMLGSLVFFSFANASKSPESKYAATVTEKPAVHDSSVMISAAKSLGAMLYDELELEEKGLSEEAVEYAVTGYQKLLDRGEVQNSRYLTIIDMSQSSRNKRLYILDMENQELAWNTFVSHGKNSGVDQATRFSNKFNSEASSLGFYVTKGTYRGKHGLSLRLCGKEQGFNNNAEARGVVVHGASYVNPSRVNSAYMGRSQGCPALSEREYIPVINMIKNGSVMFVYHPTENYISQSQLING